MADNILFVVGASGVGKTAALRHLQSLPDFAGACYFFDHIGVPSVERLEELDRQGVSWQAQATRTWIEKLGSTPDALSLLEGQTAPSCIAEEAERLALRRWSTVLLECDSSVRRQRLTERGQLGLATARMENWAAYLRGQADALRPPVINTSNLSVEEVAALIRSLADAL